MSPPPTLLSIGHLTRDLRPDGSDRPGGSVLYVSLTAQRLGLDVAVVTAADGPSFARRAFHGTAVRVHCRADGVTTTHLHQYEGQRRRQWRLATAGPLGPADLPPAWCLARLVHLGPVAGEVDPCLADAFPDAIVVATVQGWLRRRGEGGLLQPAPWPIPDPVLRRADAVVLSDEDLGQQTERLAESVRAARALVLTQGAAGATLFAAGQTIPIPAFPAKALDPTGAGDVFAGALLVRLGEGADLPAAARFASAAASCSVEGFGPEALPTRRQVLDRLNRGTEEHSTRD
ncbi:MAG: ribokinase [Chloroflexi bacterium]|nr:ribokinase [Chloroflexota bacterium]